MTIAIDYVIGKNPAHLREVFGLQVAIFNWIKAFLRFSREETITFLIDDVKAWNQVLEMASEVGVDPKRLVAFDRRFVEDNYRHLTTIFRPDPIAQELLWRRETVSGPGYNFCGLAHAISGLETGVLLEQYCLAPTTRSDAIVCPSHAVKAAIQSFFDCYDDYLRQKFKCDYRCPVQLPIIPLGIDVEKFVALGAADKRAAQRTALGIKDDETVILWVGRLSHAIKAHPLAMFQAVERAAEISGKPVHFVMLGYFVVESDEQHFRNLAKDVCHRATVTFVANRDERFPDGLWAAGDIFLSLIDNMQESFGLTPIEAMAAGLPRVLSDWDGYRDSVTHGDDGFLVTTRQPPPGMGNALSKLLLDGRDEYGGYLARTALSVSIDQEMAAQCLSLLILDPSLRQRMAAKARERVRSTYDWARIIPSYERLWAEMAALRQADFAKAAPVQWKALPPQAPDPYSMYERYPTQAFRESDRVTVAMSADAIKGLWKHEINNFGLDMMISPDHVMKLVSAVSQQGTPSIRDVLQLFPELEAPRKWRTIGWLVKLGILRLKSV